MCPLSIKFTNVPRLPIKNTKMVGDFHDYLIHKGSLITTKRGMQTKNINSCTAGVVMRGTSILCFMQHRKCKV